MKNHSKTLKKHSKSTERKNYLTQLVSSLQTSPNNQTIRHLGHFAYDKSNHELLLSLNLLKLLQSLLSRSPSSSTDFLLGALCNLSSNDSAHKEIDCDLLLSLWPSVSIHGHRSISLIFYNLRYRVADLKSPDKQAQNILILAEERFSFSGFKNMGNYMIKPNTHKKTQFGESSKVLFASSEMQGWRVSMEDSKIINLSLDEQTMLFAVFDGHGGGEVAKFASRHFSSMLLKNKFFESGDLENALISTFVEIDDVLKDLESVKELIRIRDGLNSNCPVKNPKTDLFVGCTALVVLIRNRRMFVANAGDCRCVLSRSKHALELSQDHKPTLRKEKQRILRAGGRVSEGRINRGLNLSRSLGDFAYKQNFSLAPDQQMVIPNPDVITVDLVPKDDFFLMACDGIWESLSSQDCVEFVEQGLKDFPLSKVTENILEKCLAPKPHHLTGCDNMTVILVKFKPDFFNEDRS